MASKKPFEAGEMVYARWFGDEVLRVVGEASVTFELPAAKILSFPHYVCEHQGVEYVIPRLHLSRTRISAHTGDSNRRQLDIFAHFENSQKN